MQSRIQKHTHTHTKGKQMRDMAISLLGTATMMPLIIPHIIGWAATKELIMTVVARFIAYWSTVNEDASDW